MSTTTIYENDLIGMSHVRDGMFIVRYHCYINYICYDNTCVFTYDNDRDIVPTYDFGNYDIHWFNTEMDVWGVKVNNRIGEFKPYYELIHDDENGGLTIHDIPATILFEIDWEDGTALFFTELDMTCAWIFCFVEDSDIWRAAG